jgi:hypothetical protein
MNLGKSFALCVSLGLAGAMLPARSAFASNLDFDLDNETSTNINAIYLSPNAQTNWGDAIPDGATNAGTTNSITFNNDASGNNCYYDFQVSFDSGLVSHLYDIDLCSATKVVVDTTDDGHIKYIVTYVTNDH